MLLKDEANIEIFTALEYIFEPSKFVSQVGLNNLEKLFRKLPEFLACNSKCDLHFCYIELYSDLHSASANDTKINAIDVLMGLKAKSSTFREFCEKFMKPFWLPVNNSNNERFFKNITCTNRKGEEDEGRKHCYMWNVTVW